MNKFENAISDNTSIMKIMIECMAENGINAGECLEFITNKEKIKLSLEKYSVYDSELFDSLAIYFIGDKSMIVNVLDIFGWCRDNHMDVVIDSDSSENKIYIRFRHSVRLTMGTPK